MSARSWSTADDWMTDFLAAIMRSSTRRARVASERFVPDADTQAIRKYDEKTERDLRFIIGRERQLEVLERRRAIAAGRATPTADPDVQRALITGRHMEAKARALASA